MTTPMPPIVTRTEWERARAELLIREKELTRLKDSVSAARRRLPMVEVAANFFLVLQLAHPYVGEMATSPEPLREAVHVLTASY
jgi:hypothetical protein